MLLQGQMIKIPSAVRGEPCGKLLPRTNILLMTVLICLRKSLTVEYILGIRCFEIIIYIQKMSVVLFVFLNKGSNRT